MLKRCLRNRLLLRALLLQPFCPFSLGRTPPRCAGRRAHTHQFGNANDRAFPLPLGYAALTWRLFPDTSSKSLTNTQGMPCEVIHTCSVFLYPLWSDLLQLRAPWDRHNTGSRAAARCLIQKDPCSLQRPPKFINTGTEDTGIASDVSPQSPPGLQYIKVSLNLREHQTQM